MAQLELPPAAKRLRQTPPPSSQVLSRTFSVSRETQKKRKRKEKRKKKTKNFQLRTRDSSSSQHTPRPPAPRSPGPRVLRLCWPGACHDAPVDSGSRFRARCSGWRDRNAGASRCTRLVRLRGRRRPPPPACWPRSSASWTRLPPRSGSAASRSACCSRRPSSTKPSRSPSSLPLPPVTPAPSLTAGQQTKIRNAERRIFLSTLYIGRTEKELVRACLRFAWDSRPRPDTLRSPPSKRRSARSPT